MKNLDKEEAIKQLNEIHISLVDSKKFRPYNYDALIVWGFITVIILVFLKYFYDAGLMYGTLFLSFALIIGSVIEYMLVINENKKYDIDKPTALQNFIFTIFIFSMIFGVIATILLVQHDEIAYCPILWMYIIGLPKFITGFCIHSQSLKLFGKINMIVAFVFFCITIIFTGNEQLFLINTIVSILGLGFGHIYLGLKLKKENI